MKLLKAWSALSRAVRSSAVVGRLACKLGLHEWEHDAEIVESTLGKPPLCVIWWNCARCSETKLKCLLR